MSKSTWIALGIVVLAGGWLASGEVGGGEAQEVAEPAAPEPVLVQAAASQARQVERFVVVQGDADSFRNVQVRSRAEGYVERLAVAQGDRVAQGDLLMALDPGELRSQRQEAGARLDQAQEDYEAGRALVDRGVLSSQALRERRTAYEAARAEVDRIDRLIAEARIEAPFGGVVENVAAELGEVVRVGEAAATVVDLSPLRVNVRISQQDVAEVKEGGPAAVAFATGAEAWGRVCFISRVADPETRTFLVEVRVPNPEGDVPSGVSAEVRIPVGAVEAHLVSPAILALGDDGRLGVKTVEAENEVAFHPVEVVQAEAQGVWVRGVPDAARIVTLGQGFVRRGETVRVSETGVDALPEPPQDAASPIPDDAPDPAICDLDPQEDMASVASPARERPAAGAQAGAAPSGAGGGDVLPAAEDAPDTPRAAPEPRP